MYYCMSEKLYPGSLSCLFNARESLDGVIFECATRERLHRDFFFMWKGQVYHCVDADNYICDKYDL